MASDKRTNELNQLVVLAGSEKKASELILKVKGVAPTPSAIHKARKGGGLDYTVQSYIDDLKKALLQ